MLKIQNRTYNMRFNTANLTLFDAFSRIYSNIILMSEKIVNEIDLQEMIDSDFVISETEMKIISAAYLKLRRNRRRVWCD
jgi:hypothetical protein